MFGKKGEKLVKMQSKQGVDSRFRIDAKFVDDDSDEEEEQAESFPNKESLKKVESERSWQMGILEQVVGSKIDTSDSTQKAARKKRMLRYDPSKEEHQKLLRTTAKEAPDEDHEVAATTAGKKKQKKQDIDSVEPASSGSAPEVSKEVFYVVTDTLAESLKTRGDGFSLLNMFGSGQAQDKRANELKKVSDAKILVKLDKDTLNPFKYDSSSEEEGENVGKHSAAELSQKPLKKEKQQTQIVMESFFIPRNDARLKGKNSKIIIGLGVSTYTSSFPEGAKFFRFKKKDAPEEDYEAVRNRLKLLIKTKINKTKKNLVASSGGRGLGHKKRIKKHH